MPTTKRTVAKKPATQTKTSTREPQRLRRPKVFAGDCPINPQHTGTRVYKTDGRTRRCVCDDCGSTWKLSGEFADDLKEFAITLATSLETATRVDPPDGQGTVIMIDAGDANAIVKRLRELTA